MLTYFVVQTFEIGKRGMLIADPAVQMQSAGQATRTAERLALKKAGVVAFSRTGDPETGDFDDAKILYIHGQVPAEMAEAA
ncbi:hypothetical protein [Aureimonas glaciei]|uniref:Uncharacterized protein n=1 Tax=Aureimonas glaciei TaxID=1776957 RepID=A0A916Y4Y6_9HYPH|nr:hypothetical protein [Aureimonas glaciei]GGD31070.1 hypothetical protein GCM10011335_37660 [Aureimonas glaciei]